MLQLITADFLAKGKGRRGVIYQLDELNGGLYFWTGSAFRGLNAAQLAAFDSGNILSSAGALVAVSEATPYVTLTATGTAFTGACELAGWYCSVAAGNITIYDATSATGTPIVPATALVVGPLPIFGAGTTGKLALTTGCHVVLSGAATVRVLVA